MESWWLSRGADSLSGRTVTLKFTNQLWNMILLACSCISATTMLKCVIEWNALALSKVTDSSWLEVGDIFWLINLSIFLGVPISTQWEDSGYYYPVQVAQYGLSHFSKNLTEPRPNVRIMEDGYVIQAKWQIPKGAFVRRHFNSSLQTHIMEFNSRGNGYNLALHTWFWNCFEFLKINNVDCIIWFCPSHHFSILVRFLKF